VIPGNWIRAQGDRLLKLNASITVIHGRSLVTVQIHCDGRTWESSAVDGDPVSMSCLVRAVEAWEGPMPV